MITGKIQKERELIQFLIFIKDSNAGWCLENRQITIKDPSCVDRFIGGKENNDAAEMIHTCPGEDLYTAAKKTVQSMKGIGQLHRRELMILCATPIFIVFFFFWKYVKEQRSSDHVPI